MPECSVPDCPGPTVGRGYCDRHYRCVRRYGSPYPPPRPHERVDIAEAAGLYEQGAAASDLAARYGVSYGTVQRVLTKSGVPLRGNTRTPQHTARLSQARRQFDLDPDQLRDLRQRGMSTAEIGEALGAPREVVRERMVELGIPRLEAKARLEHNTWYRRGWTIDKHGYILDKAPGHPHATASGYVRRHRLALERELGRYLNPAEVVHHLDGDPQNNDPANLRLFASNADHLRAEWGDPDSKMRRADRRRKRQQEANPRESAGDDPR